MEVELGLKITRTRDESTCISDFQFAKDRAGPIFFSRETDAIFILTAQHLKGYKKENIDINISEDGTQISVSGEKEVEEIHMMVPRALKKEVKTKGFRKKFRIPDEVDLDRIKAKYDEEEAVLRIVMPKMVKGICRVGIVEEDEVGDRVTPEPEPEPQQIGLPEKVPEETTPAVKKKSFKKAWKPCPPLVLGGSSLLVSIIFLVIHYIRARKS